MDQYGLEPGREQGGDVLAKTFEVPITAERVASELDQDTPSTGTLRMFHADPLGGVLGVDLDILIGQVATPGLGRTVTHAQVEMHGDVVL